MEKDNCLHVFVILFSAEGVVIRFPLSTNSSNMRHIVFWFSPGRITVPTGENSAPKESATMQQTSPSSHKDEANEKEETS